MKNEKPMPLWARLVAALVGFVLFPAGAVILCVVRPLDWPILSVSIAAVVSGGTLLFAALSGEWFLD
jgi:hypothetical protein